MVFVIIASNPSSSSSSGTWITGGGELLTIRRVAGKGEVSI
jgi:hypothetical protein